MSGDYECKDKGTTSEGNNIDDLASHLEPISGQNVDDNVEELKEFNFSKELHYFPKLAVSANTGK